MKYKVLLMDMMDARRDKILLTTEILLEGLTLKKSLENCLDEHHCIRVINELYKSMSWEDLKVESHEDYNQIREQIT